MTINEPTLNDKETLLNKTELNNWNMIIKNIKELYDVDDIWSKGFGKWIYEYKFRRGGKTLCTLYMKENEANILFTFGKDEREKYENMKNQFSKEINDIYDNTTSFHDGKWLWFPISSKWEDIKKLLNIKRKPNKKI